MTSASHYKNDYKESKKSSYMKGKIDLYPEQIKYSWKDKQKGITLPKYLTEDLAYLIGVHIGAGFMNIYKRPNQIEYNILFVDTKPMTKIFICQCFCRYLRNFLISNQKQD
jgi:hypothetical protein